MRNFLTVAFIFVLMVFTDVLASDNEIEVTDPLAEDCRRQLNSCLDQVENRVPGALRGEWMYLESLWRVMFDLDYCCDEYKKCMHKIGRNRP